MPLHPPGPTPCTLKETESAAPVYTKVVKTSCHITQCIIMKEKVLSSYKSRSLASKCPQRISLVCAPERDVTFLFLSNKRNMLRDTENNNFFFT
jgi:hypothetical protein